MNKSVFPGLLAIALMPILSFLHECGHYLAASAFGAKPQFHFAYVRIPGGQTGVADFCSNAAGPLVDAVVAIGGFLWLRQRHRARGDAPPGLLDWTCTIFVLRAAGPIFGFVGTLVGGSVVADEAEMSLLLGLPRWLLPGVLALLALTLIVAAVRMLPRGYRFLPLLSIHLGAVLGVAAHLTLYYLWTGKLPEYPV